jgi:hypothetical protein
MSLFGKNKHKLTQIELEIQASSANAARFQKAFDSVVQNELTAIKRLGLPLPTLQRDASCSYKLGYINVTPPSYIAPPNLLIRAIELSPTAFRRPHDPTAAYCILGSHANIEAAKARYAETTDWTIMVKDYDGVWLSRDPYAMCDHLKWPQSRYYPNDSTAALINRYTIEPHLRRVDGFTRDQIEQMEHRLAFTNLFLYDLIRPRQLRLALMDFNSTFKLTDARHRTPVSDDILFKLPVDEPVVPEQFVTLQILPNSPIKPAVMRQFLESLRRLTAPVAFEIVAANDTIYFQLACHPKDKPTIQRQIVETYFRDFAVIDKPDLIPNAQLFALRPWLLQYEEIKTLTPTNFAVDPYLQLFPILEQLSPTDTVCIQLLIAPLPDNALATISNWLHSYAAQPDFVPKHRAQYLTNRARVLEQKSAPWRALLTLFASDTQLLNTITDTFVRHYETISPWRIPEHDPFATNSVYRDFGGFWMVLGTDEVAALAHFPLSDNLSARLETAAMKAKLPPPLYCDSGIPIGQSQARGQTKTVTLPEAVRDRHLYVVGKSGTGKSTLLLNAAVADIKAGHGLAIIDPHGDLVEALLDRIPSERVEDTIYADFRDKDHPIALNILDAQSDDEIDLLAEDLLITFRRTTESWGDKMHAILLNTFHTLLRAPGATFVDIATLITNQAYRERILTEINNPQLSNYWQHEFTGYAREAQPILTRMHKFTLNSSLHTILSQTESSLNFYDIIGDQKIFLANISKGKLGADTSKLLGSILVSQIQLAAMRQAALPSEFRRPFYLYVDEFQNFTSSAFETILSEARKYKLCLTLAHQFINQLDPETRQAIFGNVGTKILFSISPADAQTLRYELGSFEPLDVVNLPNYSALCVPASSAKDTFSFNSQPPTDKLIPTNRLEIIEHTREAYASQPQALATEQIVTQVPSQPLPESIPALRPVSTKPLRTKAAEVAMLGRGGQQHKYLQQLIKRMGEDNGYKATIEKQVLDGVGSVDVALEKTHRTIACEISVTSTKDYELSNIEKCLAAGFTHVCLISTQPSFLAQARELTTSRISQDDIKRIHFLRPEEVIAFIEELDAGDSDREETVKGYKVTVRHKPVTDSDRKARQEIIGKTIMQALKRFKEPG